MSVSRRLGAFLSKHRFLLCLWYSRAKTWRWEGRTHGSWSPGQPHRAWDLNTMHSQGWNKGNGLWGGGCSSAIFKLPIRTSKITWLELPHLLWVNHTLLGWSFKPSVFQTPDQNILKKPFLASHQPPNQVVFWNGVAREGLFLKSSEVLKTF